MIEKEEEKKSEGYMKKEREIKLEKEEKQFDRGKSD